jgi:hypothetical protein
MFSACAVVAQIADKAAAINVTLNFLRIMFVSY